MINRKIIGFFAYVLLAVVLSSCGNSDSKYPTKPSKFIITRIEPNTKNTSIYLVEPIERLNLNMNHTWVVDSVGKFNAGDTLSFQHYR
jgi:hypothetical protein